MCVGAGAGVGVCVCGKCVASVNTKWKNRSCVHSTSEIVCRMLSSIVLLSVGATEVSGR